jgi:hypothetical protein
LRNILQNHKIGPRLEERKKTLLQRNLDNLTEKQKAETRDETDRVGKYIDAVGVLAGWCK